MGGEGLQAMVKAKFSVCDVQQRRVSSMSIEEDQFSSVGSRNAASKVVEDGEEGGRREPHGSWGPRVLVGLGVCESREQPDVEVILRRDGRGFGHGGGDDFVGIQRKVWPVLLDCAERLDED